MTSPEVKASKKRRQEGDPESARRKQKKQKKVSLSNEFVHESSPEPEALRNDGPQLRAEVDPALAASPKSKKDKKKKKSKSDYLLLSEANGGDANANAALEASPEKIKKSKKNRSAPDPLIETPDAGRLTPPPTADEARTKKSRKRDVGSSQMSPEGESEKNGVRQGDGDAGAAKPKKSKKKKEEGREAEVDDKEQEVPRPVSITDSPEAKRKKRKTKSHEIQATPPPQERLTTDSPSTNRTPKPKTSKRRAAPPPVVMQEVARWVPLWPRGWHQPVTAAIEQHFAPKLHRYDGDMGGVLLGYSNVCLNDRPTRKGAATQDQEAVKLLSVNEFGVGFCWLIADLELFLPKRGSWMEGELILQNQGHVGVVCWDKFNASIEASRLPPKWTWVAAPEDDLANGDFSMDVDGDQGEEYVASATPLGYWTDESGSKVEGKLRFRIKNYDVGLSGDHSFLCIEGTMLDEEQENRLREKELKLAGGAGGFKRRPQRMLPEFSMTDLGVDQEAEKSKRWRKVSPTEDHKSGDGAEEDAYQEAEEGLAEGEVESAEEVEAMNVEEE